MQIKIIILELIIHILKKIVVDIVLKMLNEFLNKKD